MAESKDEKKDEKNVNARLLEEIQALTESLSKAGGSVCDRFILVALKDEQVQRHFVKHILDNEIFMGAFCWQAMVYSDEIQIIFEFRCAPPRICLVPIRFLVRMNVVSGKIIEIIDPFMHWR